MAPSHVRKGQGFVWYVRQYFGLVLALCAMAMAGLAGYAEEWYGISGHTVLYSGKRVCLDTHTGCFLGKMHFFPPRRPLHFSSLQPFLRVFCTATPWLGAFVAPHCMTTATHSRDRTYFSSLAAAIGIALVAVVIHEFRPFKVRGGASSTLALKAPRFQNLIVKRMPVLSI